MPRESDAGALSTNARKRGPKDQNKGNSVLKQENKFKVDLKQENTFKVNLKRIS